MLSIAAHHADIVGISAGEITGVNELRDKLVRAGDLVDEKLEWVRAAAGARLDRLELNILTFGVEVGDRRAGAERLANQWMCEPDQILASPHFLAGTPEEMARALAERRERWGINYPVIPGDKLEEFAPVIPLLT